MNRPTQLQRSRLLAGGAGALATATLGGWSTAALTQSAASIKLPYVNGKRSLVAFPEKRPMIVLASLPLSWKRRGGGCSTRASSHQMTLSSCARSSRETLDCAVS